MLTLKHVVIINLCGVNGMYVVYVLCMLVVYTVRNETGIRQLKNKWAVILACSGLRDQPLPVGTSSRSTFSTSSISRSSPYICKLMIL